MVCSYNVEMLPWNKTKNKYKTMNSNHVLDWNV